MTTLALIPGLVALVLLTCVAATAAWRERGKKQDRFYPAFVGLTVAAAVLAALQLVGIAGGVK